MDESSSLGPTAAAVALSVMVAGVSAGACDSEDTTDGQGGSGGTASGTTSSTSSSGHTSCDPMCAGVSCPQPQSVQATGEVDGNTLTITIRTMSWGGCFDGWRSTPTVDVDPALGTLVDLTTDDEGAIVVDIQMADGTTGGTVTLQAEFIIETADSCNDIYNENCDLSRVFNVSFSGSGDPEISYRDTYEQQTLERRPPMRLALVDSEGTQATVRVHGLPADLPLSFAVTDGAVQAEGATAVWQLPPRPGWYQIEAVAECGGLVATDALMVEVRPSPRRS